MTTMTDEGAVFTAYRCYLDHWAVLKLDASGEMLESLAEGLRQEEAEAMAARLARGAEWVRRGPLLLLFHGGRGASLRPGERPCEWFLSRIEGESFHEEALWGLASAIAAGESWVCGG